MKLHRKLPIHLAVLGLLACASALLLTAFSPAQQSSKLTILVRDVSGAPLSGVNVLLYQGLNTNILPDSSRTDPDGLARFLARPGQYLVAFSEDWAQRRFIPVKEQNAGANAKQGGGFPLNLGTKNTTYFFTFVVVINGDGYLVPLIDQSRDPQQAPDPYLYDGPASGETPIDKDLIANMTIQPMATAAPVKTQAAPGSAPARQNDPIDIAVLIIAVVVAGGAVVIMWTVIWMQSRGRTGRGGRNVSDR